MISFSNVMIWEQPCLRDMYSRWRSCTYPVLYRGCFKFLKAQDIQRFWSFFWDSRNTKAGFCALVPTYTGVIHITSSHTCSSSAWLWNSVCLIFSSTLSLWWQHNSHWDNKWEGKTTTFCQLTIQEGEPEGMSSSLPCSPFLKIQILIRVIDSPVAPTCGSWYKGFEGKEVWHPAD